MPTINQLVRKKKRISKKTNLKKTPALKSNPQKHGTCISVFTKTPRKPNSALRKVAKVRIVNGRIITVYIPGEGHNLSRFSDVLVSGRRIRDLPGVEYGALRGKFDLCAVAAKKNGRSKYGCNKEKKTYIDKIKKNRNRVKKTRFYYKSFSRMFILSIFNKIKTLEQKRYWRKAFFYVNLLSFNNKNKEIDYGGYFYQNYKAFLSNIFEYKKYHYETYIKNQYPYRILSVKKKLLVLKDLRTNKTYSYCLKNKK
jgi:small subunit ribosomal protein S12